MPDPINLRTVRKRAKQRQDEARAQVNRLAFGQPKGRRKLESARQEKAGRDLDQHRIDKEDGR